MIGNLISEVLSIVSKFVPDSDKAQELANEVATRAHELQIEEINLLKEQIKTNQIEAQHSSWLVAGWRPSIGWICAFALLYAGVLEPFLKYLAFLNGYDLEGFPSVDLALLLPIITGMLGLSYLRTDEKKAGVARSTMTDPPK